MLKTLYARLTVVLLALFAVIGVVAAALGAWMEWGPTDGTLNLFGWTWNVADLSSLWAPFLMIAGGVIPGESGEDSRVDVIVMERSSEVD